MFRSDFLSVAMSDLVDTTFIRFFMAAREGETAERCTDPRMRGPSQVVNFPQFPDEVVLSEQPDFCSIWVLVPLPLVL